MLCHQGGTGVATSWPRIHRAAVCPAQQQASGGDGGGVARAAAPGFLRHQSAEARVAGEVVARGALARDQQHDIRCRRKPATDPPPVYPHPVMVDQSSGPVKYAQGMPRAPPAVDEAPRLHRHRQVKGFRVPRRSTLPKTRT